MRCSLLAALLLSAAALSVASAHRSATWDLTTHREGGANDMQSLQWMLGQMRNDDAVDRGGKGGKRLASYLLKCEVMPGLHRKFIDEWKRVEKCVRNDEKRNIAYDLQKYAGDNINFVIYGEWETMEDLLRHRESRCVQDFLDFAAKKDISLEMYPLDKVTEDVMNIRERKGQSVERRGRRGGSTEDIRDGMAHVMIEYHVPPSKTEDFIDMWDKVADSVADEKDNFIFTLRKVKTMNHHFTVYGAWDSFDAYLDHACSKHVEKLKDFAAEHDITWFAEPLRVYGKYEEEE